MEEKGPDFIEIPEDFKLLKECCIDTAEVDNKISDGYNNLVEHVNSHDNFAVRGMIDDGGFNYPNLHVFFKGSKDAKCDNSKFVYFELDNIDSISKADEEKYFSLLESSISRLLRNIIVEKRQSKYNDFPIFTIKFPIGCSEENMIILFDKFKNAIIDN
jgi:hypothetical protein